MKELYRMKTLARIGGWVVAAMLFWLLLSLCIPSFHVTEPKGQLYTIRHQELRDNNPLYTDFFLESIKSNNGYLILGTSETNERPKGNYYDFLNADTAIHAAFSVICGAGRTPCTYFPLIQSNENIRGLKVIFFLNPSYGCGKLAYSNEDYFSRYVSNAIYRKANHPVNQEVDDILKVNQPAASWFSNIEESMAYGLERLRRKYYQDVAFHLDSSRFYFGLTWLDSAKVSRMPISCSRPDVSRYNYELNVGADFDVHSYTLWPHPESSYRCDELRTMIRLCKAYQVDIVFVLGPHNHIAYKKVHPEELPKIQKVSENLRQVLQQENAAYIDCTDLSTVPGVFADWQHHTSYGGYLIYQKIKAYVLEKENR